ncbi:MAG TPA: sigma-70 family RNA polymerase sigma factor [Planctomycetota bacterium]|nr:sigma-70 family RNA polymerase sigma factor [Planctomycetota bacterium]
MSAGEAARRIGAEETVRTGPLPQRPTAAPNEPPTGEAEDREEAEIVAKVVGGDRDAFRILVERHQHRVYRLAYRLCGGDADRADDLAQETFLRAYRGLAGFEHGSKLSTWLHRITVNLSISEIRHARAEKRGRPTYSIDAPLGDDDRKREYAAPGARRPVEEIVTVEERRAVLQAVETLEPDLRALVVECHLEGRSYESAAELFGIPIGTVRSRLHRARAILEQRLERYLRPR